MHRVLLEKMIREIKALELVCSYNNGENAFNDIENKEIQLLFVDIEMPGMNGFDLIEKLDMPIQLIITSANPRHAIRAFDYNVTDYLLKPYTPQRFRKAIQKVLSNYNLSSKNTDDENILMVRSNLKEVRLFYKDMLWIEALGDYVKIVTEEKNVLVLSSMKSFMDRLPKDKFLRVHKSYIVNLEKIELYNHSHVYIANKKLPLSRNSNLQLDEILNFLN